MILMTRTPFPMTKGIMIIPHHGKRKASVSSVPDIRHAISASPVVNILPVTYESTLENDHFNVIATEDFLDWTTYVNMPKRSMSMKTYPLTHWLLPAPGSKDRFVLIAFVHRVALGPTP